VGLRISTVELRKPGVWSIFGFSSFPTGNSWGAEIFTAVKALFSVPEYQGTAPIYFKMRLVGGAKLWRNFV